MPKLTREDVIEKAGDLDSLSGLDLSGLDLSNLDLSELDFSETNLSNTNLSETNLLFSNLRRTILTRAKLLNADLSHADLSFANLTNVDLLYANLEGTILNNIIGKDILTFHAYGKHFSYFCNGILKIGCKSLKPVDWLNHYEGLAKRYDYDEKSIKSYLNFINHCKELTYDQAH